MSTEQHHTLTVILCLSHLIETYKIRAGGQPLRITEPAHKGFHQTDAIVDKDLTYQGITLSRGFLWKADFHIYFGNSATTPGDLV